MSSSEMPHSTNFSYNPRTISNVPGFAICAHSSNRFVRQNAFNSLHTTSVSSGSNAH
eukprot:m.136479 g.136479  ORF g.136479 m.136479 type:complete len:57 (+) comp13997_c1_seq2:186-356(+)